MKTKKKLLIGTAIMALAAGGASAVSTMAWFQASVQASIDKSAAKDLTTYTVSGSTISEMALKFDITLAQTASQVVKLTNTAGTTAGYINGGVLPGSDTTNLTGTYEISVAWASGVSGDQKKAAYGCDDVTLTVTTPTASNPVNAIVLLGSASATDVGSGSYVYTVKVHVESSGALKLVAVENSKVSVNEAGSKATGYFAIRALNEEGLEGYADKGTWDTTATYVYGDVVQKSSNYYIAKGSIAAGTWDAQASSWFDAGTTKPVTHDHDKINVA